MSSSVDSDPDHHPPPHPHHYPITKSFSSSSSSSSTAKWVVFGSSLLLFASGCVLYALVMTGNWAGDGEIVAEQNAEALHGQPIRGQRPTLQQNPIDRTGDDQEILISPAEQLEQDGQEKEEEIKEVLLIGQIIPDENATPDPRVHYEVGPDGHMKASMDISLHIQRQAVVVGDE